MIGFEEAVIAHCRPLTFTAAPDQWTALLLRDRSHAAEVTATVLGERPPMKGRVTVGGVDLYGDEVDGGAPLFEKIGVVTKRGRLLSNLSVGENIALPYQYRTLALPGDARATLKGLMEELGEAVAPLAEKLDWRVSALEPDERRMAELLRALMAKPEFFLFLNVTDDLGFDESMALLEILKRERRPWQGAFFVIAKESPMILDSMDAIHHFS